MADPIVLSDLTRDMYTEAEQLIVGMVRATYPTLDLRAGTVLRDILIRPAASFHALDEARLEQLRKTTSLSTMQAEDVNDPAAVNAVLSNFNMTIGAGDQATGQLLVRVDAARVYTLGSDFAFTTLDGRRFTVTRNTTVRTDPDQVAGDIQLQTSTDGTYYYFILPVIADEAGAEFNIAQGTAFEAVSPLYGFVSSVAYTNFTSGVDTETLDDLIVRLPAAISQRSLTSRLAIEAQLGQSGVVVNALGVQGYGDRAQLRDKHNLHGTAVGGRIDIYARTFVGPSVVVLNKEGTRVGENTYQIAVSNTDAPGFYAVRAVAEADVALTPVPLDLSFPALGSYAFSDVRSATGHLTSGHDFDTNNLVVETAYTRYQTATIVITGVPSSDATRMFKLELFAAPSISTLQDYVDDINLRNLEADIVVRSPLICLVSCEAVVYQTVRKPVDLVALQRALADYINGRSFVQQLTRSELASIILSYGATRVDLTSTGLELAGVVRDASGITHTLAGDALDLEDVALPSKLLVPETCVFAVETQNIKLVGVTE